MVNVFSFYLLTLTGIPWSPAIGGKTWTWHEQLRELARGQDEWSKTERRGWVPWRCGCWDQVEQGESKKWPTNVMTNGVPSLAFDHFTIVGGFWKVEQLQANWKRQERFSSSRNQRGKSQPMVTTGNDDPQGTPCLNFSSISGINGWKQSTTSYPLSSGASFRNAVTSQHWRCLSGNRKLEVTPQQSFERTHKGHRVYNHNHNHKLRLF